MVLVADVDAVDLDDTVSLPHAGRLRRAARVHLADELAGPRLLRVQVEAVPVERGGLWAEEEEEEDGRRFMRICLYFVLGILSRSMDDNCHILFSNIEKIKQRVINMRSNFDH